MLITGLLEFDQRNLKSPTVHYGPNSASHYAGDWVDVTLEDHNGEGCTSDCDSHVEANEIEEHGNSLVVLSGGSGIDGTENQPVVTSEWYFSAEEEDEDDGSTHCPRCVPRPLLTGILRTFAVRSHASPSRLSVAD